MISEQLSCRENVLNHPCFSKIHVPLYQIMKRMKSLSITLGLISIVSLIGCKKHGCNDPAAENYDKTVEVNDGSCMYESNLIFWYNSSISGALQANDSQTLRFTVNNELLGSAPTTNYWDEEPGCDSLDIIKFTIPLDKKQAVIYNYSVKDEHDSVFWTGSINLLAERCHKLELTL